MREGGKIGGFWKDRIWLLQRSEVTLWCNSETDGVIRRNSGEKGMYIDHCLFSETNNRYKKEVFDEEERRHFGDRKEEGPSV